MLTAFQRQILYPRQFAAVDPTAKDRVAGLEQLWLDTDQGRVEAWLMPAEQPGPAVIFAHGNGESIDIWAEPLRRYRDLGFTVLLPEYRGYGRSAGEPSQPAITEDFVRFYDLLIERPEVDASRILFHGRSLGGGAVGGLAAERTPAAMVLESTFTSVADIARGFLVPRALVPDPWDTRSVIRGLDLPILIIHGTTDQVVPYQHALDNHQAAKNSRLVTVTAGHNDVPPQWSEIRAFVEASGLV